MLSAAALVLSMILGGCGVESTRLHLRARATSLFPEHDSPVDVENHHRYQEAEEYERQAHRGQAFGQEEFYPQPPPPAPRAPPAPLPCGGDLAPESEKKVRSCLLRGMMRSKT